MTFILASGSPRRHELLKQVVPTFKIHVSDIEEVRDLKLPTLGNQIADLARQKAEAVAKDYQNQPDTWILGSDTMVCLGQEALGKPTNKADAANMLSALSNQYHEVMTGLALIQCTSPPTLHVSHDVSEVHMREITPQEIETYIATGEPMDKAGSYAIQGHAGKFITEIKGEYENIVGLPLNALRQLLKKAAYPHTIL